MLGRTVLLLIVAAATGCQRIRIDRPGSTPPEDVAAEEVRDFVRYANRHRQDRKCPVLVWDEQIAKVAKQHSAEMARYNYLGHTNRAGQTPFARLTAGGIRYGRAAENIAQGQRTGREVFNSWVTSPGHRQNIEECRYTHHGVALVGLYWTHLFTAAR